MAVQLAFPVFAEADTTLDGHVRTLVQIWAARTGAPVHAQRAAAITAGHFASWRGRALTSGERSRLEAYFRGVLRRRIVSSADPDAHAARSRLIARSIEQDLLDAGWDPARAARQASAAAGIGLSA